MYGISTYMKNRKSTKFRQVYKSHDSYVSEIGKVPLEDTP